MSILIKGMAMPKNCAECPFIGLGYDQLVCRLQDCVLCDKAKTTCPLIELPPHGDLIDRRKLPLAFVDITDLPTDRCLPVYLQEDVDSAPIVVESEDGDG